MRHALKTLIALTVASLPAMPLLAQETAEAPATPVTCGGDFNAFLDGLRSEAKMMGIPDAAIETTLAGARLDQKVLSMDRAQGVFRQTFLEFSQRTVSQARLDIGRQKLAEYKDVFAKAEEQYGVAPGVITAFWAMETDFGAVQGNFNTRNALVTLAHDCRRPELFRREIFALMTLSQHGDIDPDTNTGAWAGEIGQVQMLPKDIVAYGVDGDGDGHVRLKESAADVIMTAAHFIQTLGYKRGEPWVQEVTIPENLPFEKSGLGGPLKASDWFALGVTPLDGKTEFGGLAASLMLPQGRKGPAFLAYPNFDIYLKWNQSFIYTTSAAYFATRLSGAPPYQKGAPEQGLDTEAMKALQEKLQARGHDVGKIDGILGGGTRVAIQKEQARLGLPADGWATPALLERL